MGIDRDFYHFASGIDAAQLGAAIGANEIIGPSDIVVADIAPFDCLEPAMLGYQSNTDAVQLGGVTGAVIITTPAIAELLTEATAVSSSTAPGWGLHAPRR